MEDNKNSIKKEWEEYYNFLEGLRQSGVVNMYGAAPYLEKYCKVDKKTSREILGNWMTNYNELSKMYNWR